MKLNKKPKIAISPPTSPKQPIFTRNFLLATLAYLFTYASMHVLVATMPIYVVKVGGRESQIGLVMGMFAMACLAARLFVGLATDIWGRKRFMLVGGVGLALSPLLYIISTSVAPLIVGRLLQGAAFGTISAANLALIATIVPPLRRGEAISYYSMSSNLAMAAGPALGIVVMNSLGFPSLFLISGTMGLAAFALSLPIREPSQQPRSASEKRPPLVVVPVLFPTSILFSFALTYGAVYTFLPLFAVNRGLSNPGLFFTVQAIVMLSLRNFPGLLSDRFGRSAVAIPGLLLIAISVMLISQASSLPMFLVAATIFAMGFASLQPSLMALVIDRVKPEMRGAAMGTYFSAMDAGIGGGSFLWGVVAGLWGYARMYQIASLMPLIGLGLFIWISRRQHKAKRH